MRVNVNERNLLYAGFLRQNLLKQLRSGLFSLTAVLEDRIALQNFIDIEV
ncbi:MAG: hypothetical protein ACTSRS_23085 [Candidatus Helarchaeota archaeon]